MSFEASYPDVCSDKHKDISCAISHFMDTFYNAKDNISNSQLSYEKDVENLETQKSNILFIFICSNKPYQLQ
jgi:hypothetical protein